MMSGTNDAAAKIENGIKIYNTSCCYMGNHAELVEYDCHHHSYEQFEEPFNPKMDDPKSPGIDNRKMGRTAKEHCRKIEKRNCYRRVQKQ